MAIVSSDLAGFVGSDLKRILFHINSAKLVLIQ